jgi:hypothetical protein
MFWWKKPRVEISWHCPLSTSSKFNVGWRISLKTLVLYQNARQIFSLLVRYRTVRQRRSPISLITDVGISVHLCLQPTSWSSSQGTILRSRRPRVESRPGQELSLVERSFISLMCYAASTMVTPTWSITRSIAWIANWPGQDSLKKRPGCLMDLAWSKKTS